MSKKQEVFFDSSAPDIAEDIEIDISGMTTAEIIPAASVLLRIMISGTEFQKQVATTEVVDREKKIDVRLMTTTKRMIDKKYIDKINRLDSMMRADLRRIGLHPKFLGPGNVVLPLRLVSYTMKRINIYKKEREALVDQLISEYDQAKADAKQRSPDLYYELDYPSAEEVRQKFRVDTNFFSVSFPEVLEHLDEAVYQETAEERRRQLREAMEEIKTGLRAGMYELVSNLEDKVRGLGTERKVFKSGFVNEMRTFLETFDGKNSIANDKELAEVVQKARNVLDGVSPDAIRNNIEVQVKLEKALGEIKHSLAGMVEVPIRKAVFG